MSENNYLLDYIQKLPYELQIHISEYNPSHRERMKDVFEELDYAMNWSYCDNDMCERYFELIDDDVVEIELIDRLHVFCCENCANYGRWSIQYDYRKHRRRMQQQH